jgi:hypothetical protein
MIIFKTSKKALRMRSCDYEAPSSGSSPGKDEKVCRKIARFKKRCPIAMMMTSSGREAARMRDCAERTPCSLRSPAKRGRRPTVAKRRRLNEGL